MVDPEGRLIDIVVRPDLSESPSRDDLAALSLITADGARIPLGDVSSSQLVGGCDKNLSRVWEKTYRGKNVSPEAGPSLSS